MELNKCDFLSALGLSKFQSSITKTNKNLVLTSNKNSSNNVEDKKNNKTAYRKKKKFKNIYIPLTIVSKSSVLSQKFIINRSKCEDFLSYEKFCQTSFNGYVSKKNEQNTFSSQTNENYSSKLNFL